jgi:hypothetical protein
MAGEPDQTLPIEPRDGHGFGRRVTPPMRHHPLPDSARIQARHSGTPASRRKSAIGLARLYCLSLTQRSLRGSHWSKRLPCRAPRAPAAEDSCRRAARRSALRGCPRSRRAGLRQSSRPRPVRPYTLSPACRLGSDWPNWPRLPASNTSRRGSRPHAVGAGRSSFVPAPVPPLPDTSWRGVAFRASSKRSSCFPLPCCCSATIECAQSCSLNTEFGLSHLANMASADASKLIRRHRCRPTLYRPKRHGGLPRVRR